MPAVPSAQTDLRAPVTVVGLGRMGTALARALIEAGHRTTVWNRSPGPAEALVADGARRATSVASAAGASPIVLTCVIDQPALSEVLTAAGSALAGRVLVELTTGTPEDAHRTAAVAHDHGAAHVDGAIMAVPPTIGRPEAMLLFSGSEDAYGRAQPALEVLGSPTWVGPDPGLASLYDLALLGEMWSALAGFYHAVALVGTAEVDASTFAPLAARWLAGVAALLPDEARQIDDEPDGTDLSPLAINAAAIRHLVDVSRARGLATDVPAPIRALFERGVAAGYGAQPLSSVTRLIRPPAARADVA